MTPNIYGGGLSLVLPIVPLLMVLMEPMDPNDPTDVVVVTVLFELLVPFAITLFGIFDLNWKIGLRKYSFHKRLSPVDFEL